MSYESLDLPLNLNSLPEHYNFPIQPKDYIAKNNLNFFEGNVIKYITRYKKKDGLKDLIKAIDNINSLIKNTYGEDVCKEIYKKICQNQNT